MKYTAIAFVCACVPAHPHRPITNCSQPAEQESGHLYLGHSWNIARLGELVSGESTVDDAKCALGQPTSESMVGGDLLVTWSYSDITPGQPNPKLDLVSIAFASDGVMKGIAGRSTMR